MAEDLMAEDRMGGHRPVAGPTGNFPYGRLNDEDEGELQIALGADRASETVWLDFGKPVAWIGMRPEQAEAIAAKMVAAAARARKVARDV